VCLRCTSCSAVAFVEWPPGPLGRHGVVPSGSCVTNLENARASQGLLQEGRRSLHFFSYIPNFLRSNYKRQKFVHFYDSASELHFPRSHHSAYTICGHYPAGLDTILIMPSPRPELNPRFKPLIENTYKDNWPSYRLTLWRKGSLDFIHSILVAAGFELYKVSNYTNFCTISMAG